ncbi:hypothetical protein CHUAL_006333 [Chamberlinius hualienensis]
MASSGENHPDLLEQFINVTGVDNDRAKFYLESSAWNLQVALASYYEEDIDFDVQEIPTGNVVRQPENVQVPSNDDEPQIIGEQKSSSQPPTKQPSKYATIFGVDDDENDSEGDEGQAFYAGGSERSGQQILGPKKKKGDLVGDIFKAAKDLGAETVDQEMGESSSGGGGGRSTSFHGTGYRLGDNKDDVQVIPAVRSGGAAKAKKDVVLKMWKDGFTINDAIQQRTYDDPTNKEFLDSIRRGEIPSELIREARGGEVNVMMEDHRNEEFDTPKQSLKAFAGKGHMLGSPAPPTFSSGATNASPQDNQKNENVASESVKVDPNQPTTTIQIRLADGSRLAPKLNHTHTVGDLRRYIIAARPQFASSEFSLMTTFPNRQLADDLKSIKDENLLNAVVVQKMV